MFVYNRFLGSLINKLTWFVLIAIIGLICFFGGLWVANAEEITCSTAPSLSSSITINTTLPTTGTEEYYDHNKVRDVIPTLLVQNESFLTTYGSYTLYEFYQRFTYSVDQLDGNSFRVYYQDLNFIRDNSCGDIINKFYIAQFFNTTKGNGVSNYFLTSSFPYSFYIDFNFNLETGEILLINHSNFSSTGNFSSLMFRYFSSYPTLSAYTITLPFIDSYNGLRQFNTLETNAFKLYLTNLSSSYGDDLALALTNGWLRTVVSDTNPIDEIVLSYSGDLVEENTPEEPDPENPGGSDLTQIEEDLKDILEKQEEALNNQVIANGFLEGIGSTVNDFFEATTKGLGDILELLKKPFDSSDTSSNFFDDFEIEDNGGISQIVSLPLNLIQDILNNNNSCEPLTLNIFDKDVAIPSGCIMWNNAPNNIEIVYHTFICGFYSYIILTRIFKDVENFKNPNHNEVSTLDL